MNIDRISEVLANTSNEEPFIKTLTHLRDVPMIVRPSSEKDFWGLIEGKVLELKDRRIDEKEIINIFYWDNAQEVYIQILGKNKGQTKEYFIVQEGR
jgi:hypothetical protein